MKKGYEKLYFDILKSRKINWNKKIKELNDCVWLKIIFVNTIWFLVIEYNESANEQESDKMSQKSDSEN